MQTPYTPPRARLADSSGGAISRPKSVNVALSLVVLLILVQCYQQVMRLQQVKVGEMSGLAWLLGCFWLIAIGVAGFFIARGRDWARWVLGIIALRLIYDAIDTRILFSTPVPGESLFFSPVSLWLMPLAAFLAVTATILNFGPGRSGFRR